MKQLIDFASAAPGRTGGRGTNSAAVRRYNARLVLDRLRRLGTASKAELSRATGLTQNAVGLIVGDLLEPGFVQVTGQRVGRRGQPSTLLALAPDGVWAIGIGFGRDSLIGLIVDFGGEALHVVERHRPLPSPDAACNEIVALVADLRAHGARLSGKLAGIGLATPFDLASWRTELAQPPDEAWRGYDLAAAVQAKLDAPLLTENDGTAAAVAELFRGHGRDLDDFVTLTIGPALGGGVVLGGAIRRGAAGNAGDLGLMPISTCAELGGDKAVGFETLLARASLGALRHRLAAAGTSATSSTELDAAVARHPDVLAAWIEDAAQALAEPVLSIGAILDCDAIIVDGDVGEAALDRLVVRLGEIAGLAAAEARQPPRLLVGRIGRNAAALGAAILPLHLVFSPDLRSLAGAAA